MLNFGLNLQISFLRSQSETPAAELRNPWDRMSERRRWSVGNVAIDVFVPQDKIGCRGQRH